jgi:zinc protease
MLWLLSAVIMGECMTTGSTLFNMVNFRLKNGLEVIFLKNKISSAASAGVLYKYGSADDDPKTYGIAHFLEHMMFKGTKQYPKGQLDEIIMRLGGSHNAYTSWDKTFYYATVPKNGLRTVLTLEADRMLNLSFDDAEVEPEKGAVKEEENMHIKNHPFGETIKIWFRTLFPVHPYGVEIIGYPEHIEAYNAQNTRAAYQQWYAPNNAVLIISGDFEEAFIRALVEELFGGLAASPHIPEKRVRHQDPKIEGLSRTVVQENKRASMVFCELAYPSPSIQEAKDPSIIMACSIASFLLGGNDVSLLYKDLVRHKKLATSVTVSNQTGLDARHISVDFELTPLMDVQACLTAYKTFMKELVDNGMQQDWFKTRFEEVKNQLKGQMVFATDGTSGAIRIFDRCAEGYTAEQTNTMIDTIDQVTLAQVQNVLRQLTAIPTGTLIIHPPGYLYLSS